jgi:WD repeat-containing protein 22
MSARSVTSFFTFTFRKCDSYSLPPHYSEDGRIIRHDGRSRGFVGSKEDTIQLNSESTGVQYHPTIEHVFVTSDAKGRVCLRDARMAFGYAGGRSNAGVVLTVCCRLSWNFPL